MMDKQFAIAEAICKPGKISNNLEKHGDEEVVVFAIPFTGVMVNQDAANAIAGDKDFCRSIFNDNRGFLEPMPWVREAIRFPEKYEGAVASITLPSDEVLTFENARIGDIDQLPHSGGLVEVGFQLQIAPGVGRENLLLQEYQHREVTLSIADAKIALKKAGKQRQLELVGGGLKEDEDDQQSPKSAWSAFLEARGIVDDLRSMGEIAHWYMSAVNVQVARETCDAWTEQECIAAATWASELVKEGEACKIARPHWLPIPEVPAAAPAEATSEVTGDGSGEALPEASNELKEAAPVEQPAEQQNAAA